MNTPFRVTVFVLSFQAFWIFLGTLRLLGGRPEPLGGWGRPGPVRRFVFGTYRISYLFLPI